MCGKDIDFVNEFKRRYQYAFDEYSFSCPATCGRWGWPSPRPERGCGSTSASPSEPDAPGLAVSAYGGSLSHHDISVINRRGLEERERRRPRVLDPGLERASQVPRFSLR